MNNFICREHNSHNRPQQTYKCWVQRKKPTLLLTKITLTNRPFGWPCGIIKLHRRPPKQVWIQLCVNHLSSVVATNHLIVLFCKVLTKIEAHHKLKRFKVNWPMQYNTCCSLNETWSQYASFEWLRCAMLRYILCIKTYIFHTVSKIHCQYFEWISIESIHKV